MSGTDHTVHRRKPAYAGGPSRGARTKAVSALAVLAVVVGLGAWLLSGVFGGGEPSSSSQALDDSRSVASGKLALATETVDDNGVVHGTTPDDVHYLLWGRGVQAASSDKVTLAAAGDVIGTDQVLELCDAWAGEMGDGEYDFSPFYQEMTPLLETYDLRYVNQETVVAGTGNFDYSGYPSFNTPPASIDALAGAGFNLVGLASNHVLDYDVMGAEHSLDVWAGYPQVITAGSYRSQEDRETVRLVERNGITFAFLAFCYGDNYYQTDLPDTWHLCGFDKPAIEADVRRAQQVADVVIVAMHWGTEYTIEPNEQQVEYAKFLADLDVDLVLGSHAHVTQPIRYVSGDSGNSVPVVYGMSDFISGWTLTNYILSGLFTCDFVRVQGDESTDAAEHIELQNLAWYPAIEWSDGNGQIYVRLLKDMDEATTNANTRTEDVDNDYTYLRDFVNGLGMEVPVVM